MTSNITRGVSSEDEMTFAQNENLWQNDSVFDNINQAVSQPFFNGSTVTSLDGIGSNCDPCQTDPCHVSPPFSYEDYTQLPAVRYTFIVLYALVAFLAATGNTMVIWTIFRNKHMRTVTNYYIMNLAISDFLVATFVMPLKLLEYTAPCTWHMFTNTLCSVLYYVLPVFVFTSVLTLVAIALERYYAVVHPFAAMKMHGKSRTRKILAATWIIPIVVAAPYLYCTSFAFTIQSPMGLVSRQICNDRFDEIDEAIRGSDTPTRGTFRKAFFFFLFVAIYLLPMAIILITCIRIIHTLLQPIVENNGHLGDTRNFSRKREENKRKVARMVIVVAVSFILAWTPFYLVSVISQLQKHSFLKSSNFLFTMLITHLFGFGNSGVNPLIYYLMSERFRRSFAAILDNVCCCFCRLFGLRSTEHPSADWFSAIDESVESGNHSGSRRVVVKLSVMKNDNITPANGHAYPYHK